MFFFLSWPTSFFFSLIILESTTETYYKKSKQSRILAPYANFLYLLGFHYQTNYQFQSISAHRERGKMKREGRQHGVVQTYPILPLPWSSSSGEQPRRINKLQSVPTAGLFTKVSQKPTNHSKFTGKCGRPRCISCHIHPCCKSKEKTKGTQKLRSRDVITNFRLVTWRAVDTRPGLKFSGFSASEILDHLGSDYIIDHEDEIEEEDDDTYEEYNYGLTDSDWIAESNSAIASRIVEIEEVEDGEDGDSNPEKEEDEDEDDDKMSFCDVGIVWKNVEEGDETWCLVEDLQNCT